MTIIAGCILAVVLVSTAVCLAIPKYKHTQEKSWREAHPLSDPKAGFQMYWPAKLPDGYAITGKRISVHPEGRYTSMSAMVEINLSTKDWVYGITQSLATGDDSKRIDPTVAQYDPDGNRKQCVPNTSPNGQTYLTCHRVDWGKVDVYEVTFLKGRTLIYTTFPKTIGESSPQNQLDAYVDSFRPASPEGIPVTVGGV